MKLQERNFRQLKMAVGIIEKYFQRKKHRRLFRIYRDECIRMAYFIQQRWRFILHQRARQSAAVLIQRCLLGFKARQWAIKLKSAQFLISIYRATIERRNFLACRRTIRIIQATVRGKNVRHVIHTLQLVSRLQAHARAYLTRKAIYKLMENRIKAVHFIGTQWLRKCAIRKEKAFVMHQQKKIETLVLLLQCYYRKERAKRTFKLVKLMTAFQAHVRGTLYRIKSTEQATVVVMTNHEE